MRIITSVAPDGATTLTLTDAITAASAADLERALAAAGREPGGVVLDLSRVRLIDRPMLRYLDDARHGIVRAITCPDHVARWFARAVAPDPED